MKKHPVVRFGWYAINTLLIISFLAVLYGIGWEYSTRSYLRGFSDAIIPASDNPEQKAESILAWIANGPARRTTTNPAALSLRDPTDTLNFQQLLEVCGTATNAFVNLAQSAGLQARRLLLLDGNLLTKHVVVEVLVGGRWIVVDPAYHTIFRLPNGQLVTRTDLLDLAIFRQVTSVVPNYPQDYTYESAVHLRLGRIPVVGKSLRKDLNFIWPAWEESINWTLLLERDSFAMLFCSAVFFCFTLAIRFLFVWYCSSRLGIVEVRIRDRIAKAGNILAGNTPSVS
jgi:Transglutaminase-like superfamily